MSTSALLSELDFKSLHTEISKKSIRQPDGSGDWLEILYRSVSGETLEENMDFIDDEIPHPYLLRAMAQNPQASASTLRHLFVTVKFEIEEPEDPTIPDSLWKALAAIGAHPNFAKRPALIEFYRKMKSLHQKTAGRHLIEGVGVLAENPRLTLTELMELKSLIENDDKKYEKQIVEAKIKIYAHANFTDVQEIEAFVDDRARQLSLAGTRLLSRPMEPLHLLLQNPHLPQPLVNKIFDLLHTHTSAVEVIYRLDRDIQEQAPPKQNFMSAIRR